MMEIGSIELPIISEINELDDADVDEIKSWVDSVAVKHESDVTALTITGFLNIHVHSQNLSIDEQKRELKKLRKNRKKDNGFVYKDYNGYLLVEEVDFVDNPDSRIVNEFEITAWYFPWPKYCPDDRP